MSFNSEMRKIEEIGSKAVKTVGIGRDIISGIIGVAVLAGVVFLQVRFNLIESILMSFAESDQFKDPAMWWGYVFPFAFVGVWVFGALYMIFTTIVSIVSIKSPYGKVTMTLAYIKSVAVAMPFVMVGFLFAFAGVCIGIGCVVNGEYAAIAGGILVGLMGLAAMSVGVGQIVANTLAFRDYKATGGIDFTPSRITIFANYAKERIPLVIGACVFSCVPIVLVTLALTTPDLDFVAILMMILMGLVFAGFGAWLLIYAYKDFKLFKEAAEDTDNYTDLKL